MTARTGAPVRIRAAAPADLYAAIGFLPWIAALDLPLDNLVVAEGDAGVCAAGALVALPAGPGGLVADLAVHPAWRRRGIGTALSHRLADAARDWGAAHLRSRRPTDDAGTCAFLDCLGAIAQAPAITFEAVLDPARFGHGLGRRAATASGAARPIAEADLPRLAAYYARHLGTTSAAALAKLRAVRADPGLGAISLVLERAGRLLGFVVFVHDPDGVLRLDYWFTDRQARGSVALGLLAAVAQRVPATPGLRVRFQAGPEAATTRRIARDLGATVLRSEILHELVL